MFLNYFVDRNEQHCCFQFSLVQNCLRQDSYRSPGTISLGRYGGGNRGVFASRKKRKKKGGVRTDFHSAGSKDLVLCYNVYI